MVVWPGGLRRPAQEGAGRHGFVEDSKTVAPVTVARGWIQRASLPAKVWTGWGWDDILEIDLHLAHAGNTVSLQGFGNGLSEDSGWDRSAPG